MRQYLTNIAREVAAADPRGVSWSDDQVPLEQRGVRLKWIIEFFREAEAELQTVVDGYERQRSMSYIGDIPEPDSLPFPWAAKSTHHSAVTGEFAVEHLIKPLTAVCTAPLYALVPEEHRGRPDAFISHMWSNPAMTGSLAAPLQRHGNIEFVWMDLICYNQHRIEAIASDMKAVIGRVGHLVMPLYSGYEFTRLWCLWEFLCAHVCGTPIHIWESNMNAHDLGLTASRFSGLFQSVEQAHTTFEDDRRLILQAMVDTFGSIREADEQVRTLVLTKLSKDSDKPWNKPGPGLRLIRDEQD
jgi:hypothetical protein